VDRVTVLGIGNILMSDEGVGVRAVNKLMEEYTFPPQVELVDGGTTGLHGLLPVIEDTDRLIVIDAVNGKGEAGSLYRFTLKDFRLTFPKKLSAHDIGFVECMAVTEVNGRLPKSVVIIGIKPADFTTLGMELTPAIEAKLDDLAGMVLGELADIGISPTTATT
jgi:hydrogenase maturation protease